MSGGYTHTTVANEPGGHTRVCTSFYLDARALIDLYPTSSTRPFLSVELGDTHAWIGPCTDGPVTAEDVAVFRELADKAAALLAEVERIHHIEQAARDSSAA